MNSTGDESERVILDAFAREVPEVSSGVVSIRAIARIPGVRTKVAVASADPRVDAVVTCVGEDEQRIKAIRRVAPDEPMDVLPWAEEPERFIRLALSPVRTLSMTLDASEKRAVVEVARGDLARALGPNGAYRDAASRLVGWQLDIRGVDVT